MTTTPRPEAPIARHGHSLWPRLLCGHAGADIPAPRAVGPTGSWLLSVKGKKCPDRAPVGMSGRSAIRRAYPEAAYGHGMAVGDQKWGHGAHREVRHPRPPTPPSLRALTVTMGAHLRGGGRSPRMKTAARRYVVDTCTNGFQALPAYPTVRPLILGDFPSQIFRIFRFLPGL